MLEVQPSSSSKYSVFGLPYFSKLTDFSPRDNQEFNETENYFIRIARTRRLQASLNVSTPVSVQLLRLFNLDHFYTVENDFKLGKRGFEISCLGNMEILIDVLEGNDSFSPLLRNFKIVEATAFGNVSDTLLNHFFYESGFENISKNIIESFLKRELLFKLLADKRNKVLIYDKNVSSSLQAPLFRHLIQLYLNENKITQESNTR
jgi:hypothetical protein